MADLAHFAWCALVSLRLTQQDGQTLSPLTIHTFLLRWLATAQKQRRFPRSVASDIDSLLRLGRHQGPAAGLLKRLEYLHQSCTEPLAHQSDLFRLTLAIEYLKAQGWVNAVVSDEEWEPGALYTEYADVSALLVKNPNCSAILPNRASSPRRWNLSSLVIPVLLAMRLTRGSCVTQRASNARDGVCCHCCQQQMRTFLQCRLLQGNDRGAN